MTLTLLNVDTLQHTKLDTIHLMSTMVVNGMFALYIDNDFVTVCSSLLQHDQAKRFYREYLELTRYRKQV